MKHKNNRVRVQVRVRLKMRAGRVRVKRLRVSKEVWARVRVRMRVRVRVSESGSEWEWEWEREWVWQQEWEWGWVRRVRVRVGGRGRMKAELLRVRGARQDWAGAASEKPWAHTNCRKQKSQAARWFYECLIKSCRNAINVPSLLEVPHPAQMAQVPLCHSPSRRRSCLKIRTLAKGRSSKEWLMRARTAWHGVRRSVVSGIRAARQSYSIFRLSAPGGQNLTKKRKILTNINKITTKWQQHGGVIAPR